MKNGAAIVVALLAGIVLGLALGRGGTAPSTSPGTASPAAPAATTAPSFRDPAADAEIRDLRRQVEELRREARSAPSAPASSPAESAASRRERAKSIFETFRRAFVDKEGPELLKALGAVDELDESMAAFFVERHREGIENKELRDMNLLLIHLSGGPDAAAFVVDYLRDPSRSLEERHSLLSRLSGTGVPENRKLPYGGELAASTETLLASKDAMDRAGGAGLLGGNDTDDARVRLFRLAQTDPNGGVRSAAIASLGWVGDRATYERLKTFKADDTSILKRALAQLKRRFPD